MSQSWRSLDFARLNHVLIPSTKAQRDRLRQSRIGRAGRPLVRLYESLSSEGAAFVWVAVFAGAVGMDVHGGQSYALWGALTALLVASFLCTPLYRMRGVSLRVRTPRRVPVGEDAVFTLELRSRAVRPHQAIRVLGPFLPWDGRWNASRGAVKLLPAGGSARVELRARFAQRGAHHLDDFRAAALVPLGLALGPSIYSGDSRFVVVPRPARVVELSLLERGRARAEGVGVSPRRGASPELLGVRPYRSGDRSRDLHARSWARRGIPLVREYQQEHAPQLALWLDPGPSSGEALEAAVSLAAGVALLALEAEAGIDLCVPGRARAPLRDLRGPSAWGAVLDWLAEVEPGAPPTADALARLEGALGPSCVWVHISAREGGAQAESLARVRALGVPALALGLHAAAGDVDGVRSLRPDAVLRGEAIAL